jgi:transcriptional regulator NrdR family protein
MKCPHCGSRSITIESRDTGPCKRRRHECLNPECQLRFTGYELFVGLGTPTAVKDYIEGLISGKPKSTRKSKVQRLLTQQTQINEQLRAELSRG